MTAIHLEPKDIMQVYVSRQGKAHACCCGCSGTHRYNSTHRELAAKKQGYALDKPDINDKQVAKVLKVLKTAAAAGADIMLGSNFISTIVDDKLYAVYPAQWAW